MRNDGTPLSWRCVDCGFDTAPGVPCRAELAKGKCEITFHTGCEVYTVLDVIWERAGNPAGCLCSVGNPSAIHVLLPLG